MSSETSVDKLALNTRFSLSKGVTDNHRAFLKRHGFLIFGDVFSREEVAKLNREIDNVRTAWVQDGRTAVNGIPIFAGVLQRQSMLYTHFLHPN